LDLPDRFAQIKSKILEKPKPWNCTFLDFGCGAWPGLVIYAQDFGIKSIGVELNRDTRGILENQFGVKLYSWKEVVELNYRFDMIFIEDVLEHICNPRDTLLQVA
jgi:2-polyprenyl-3-methyl-5-hydroxy-6-metoxy-1,4-benzoquinol methylase